MNYLKKFNYDISILNKNQFEEHVLYILLNNLDTITIPNKEGYIENIKKNVYIKNIEKFKRKEQVEKYKCNANNSIIQDYIYYGGNIFKVLDNYNECIFLNKYFDLNKFYIYCLNNAFSLYLLLCIIIQDHCDTFGYTNIPVCVIKKYGIKI